MLVPCFIMLCTYINAGFEMEPSLPTFSTILDVNDGGELMVTEQATETLSLSNDDTEVDYTTSEDELLTDCSGMLEIKSFHNSKCLYRLCVGPRHD